MAKVKFRVFCRWCRKFLKWTSQMTKNKASHIICNECKKSAFKKH